MRASEVGGVVKEELEALTGLKADTISSVQRQGDHWEVTVDMVELHVTPNTAMCWPFMMSRSTRKATFSAIAGWAGTCGRRWRSQMVEPYLVQADAAATAKPASGGDPFGVEVGPGKDLSDPIYVYAVMDAGALALPAYGIDPERPVTALVVGSVQAVVSVVRYELFHEQAVRAGLENSNWLATQVLAHQQVLDALVATKLPVVPMRFCTIYPDILELCDSLRRYNAAFAAELQRQRGKQEWGVKQVVDIPTLQAAIAQGHPTLAAVVQDGEIERLRKQIASMTAGAAFLLKKKLANLIAERAQTIAFAVADETLHRLCAAAVDSVTSDLPKDRPEVCLNAAFWVETARYAEFEGQLEQLAGTFGPVGVRYEMSGPWPAHHFLHLHLEGQEEAV